MQPTPEQTAQFFTGVHPIYRKANKQQEESTMTYIRGPWKVAQYDYDSGTAIIETVELGPDVPDPIGYYVATVSAVDGQDPTARLIATAPELLDALKKSSQYINQLCAIINDLAGFNKVRVDDFTEPATVAILKATGK